MFAEAFNLTGIKDLQFLTSEIPCPYAEPDLANSTYPRRSKAGLLLRTKLWAFLPLRFQFLFCVGAIAQPTRKQLQPREPHLSQMSMDPLCIPWPTPPPFPGHSGGVKPANEMSREQQPSCLAGGLKHFQHEPTNPIKPTATCRGRHRLPKAGSSRQSVSQD